MWYSTSPTRVLRSFELRELGEKLCDCFLLDCFDGFDSGVLSFD